jgi:protein-disulfide isomerase
MMRYSFAAAAGAVAMAAMLVFAASPAAGQEGGLFDKEAGAGTNAGGPTNAFNKADLEFFLRHLYVMSPDIDVDILEAKPSSMDGLMEVRMKASKGGRSQERLYYVSKDGKSIIEGRSYEIAENPFKGSIDKIQNLGRPAFGKEGAPVVVAVFSDFQCPFCAKEATVLRTQLAESYSDTVRVYFHDYPLTMHPWALPAAVAGQCIQEMDPQAFWKYHDWIFENQKSITPQNINDKVAEFASANGLDSMKLSPCIAEQRTKPLVEKSIEMGRELDVTSTPTLFVNGRKLAGNIAWEQLKQIIDYEIEYQKTTKNAGDDCGCQIEFDIPGQK